MQVANSRIIITGGASGMGAACVKHFLANGAKVVSLDRDLSKAQELIAELNTDQATAIACDVTDAENAEQAIQSSVEFLGGIDVCINCAGIVAADRIVGKQGPMPLENFSQVLNVNLVGTFNIMRLAAAKMSLQDTENADGEQGVIINTASCAAFEGQVGQAAYSASKGGVVAMTLPAARELARFGIRVNTIAPGLVATPMLLGMPEELQQSLAEQVPFPKRLGKPEEYALLAHQLVENTMINGATLRLDGALRMV